MKRGIPVASDFSAIAFVWGIPQPNCQAMNVLEMVASTGLIVLNIVAFQHPDVLITIALSLA